MRTAITGSIVAVVALVVASVVGVAAAETPSSASTRTVSVEGVATAPLAQGASAATATAAYRQAMAAAEADGHQKAEFLVQKVGAVLGEVQSIAEAGGSIECSGGSESGYVEYEGEEPDFGQESGVSPTPFERAASTPSTAPATQRHHKRKHKKRVSAKRNARAASATSCTVSARVALVYTLG